MIAFRSRCMRFLWVILVLLCIYPLDSHSYECDSIAFIGVYNGSGNAAGVASLGNFLGHSVGWAMDFFDGSSWSLIENPSWIIDQWNDSSWRMIWGLPMLTNSNTTLAAGAAGEYNEHFRNLSLFLLENNLGSAVLRVGWEMNGDWFPWAASAGPSDFVTYWKNIVNTMRSVEGTNFTFIWNPTRGTQSTPPDSVYPGDEYVDYIGLDVYDEQYPTYPGPDAEWQHMLTADYGLDWLANFSRNHSKPMMLPEWGLYNANTPQSGGDDPTFIYNIAHWCVQNNVLAANFWDYQTSVLQSSLNPNATAMFLEMFGINSPFCTNDESTTTATSAAPTITISFSSLFLVFQSILSLLT